ncbi:MAG: HEAT repeat domain-containing protein [Planctomycetota bacterium]|jgi:HEAT repeat protein
MICVDIADRCTLVNCFALRQCVRSFESPNPDKRLRAVEKIAKSPSEDGLNILVSALSDPSDLIRKSASEALANLNQRGSVDRIVAALIHEQNHEVADAMALAVAKLDSYTATTKLLTALQSNTANVRQTAASCLHRYFWDQVTAEQKSFIDVLQSNWDNVATHGPAAVPALTQALQDGTAYAKKRAAQILGDIGTDESCQVLQSVLEDADADHEARVAAAKVLRTIHWHGLDESLFESVGVTLTHQKYIYDTATSPPQATEYEEPASLDASPDAIESPQRASGETEQKAYLDNVLQEITVEAAPRPEDKLIAMLDDPDMGVQASAVHALDRLRWAPETPEQQVIFCIVHGDWDAIPPLGQVAIEPLVRLLENEMAEEAATDTLSEMMKLAPSNFSDAQLRMLTRLTNTRSTANLELRGIVARQAIRELRLRGIKFNG